MLQALPEKFYDRTSRASDMIENAPKNRYPDIKAYDQTRVKLAQLNGAIGSDYINANYVLGYKERKKFICAQGKTNDNITNFYASVAFHSDHLGIACVTQITFLECSTNPKAGGLFVGHVIAYLSNLLPFHSKKVKRWK